MDKPISPNDWPDLELRNVVEYWTCTNCGKLTKDIIFEEGDSNICFECYDRFEENEIRIREGLEQEPI